MHATGWPPCDEDGDIIWNTQLSPLNIPAGGLDYPDDEEKREALFDGKSLAHNGPAKQCVCRH